MSENMRSLRHDLRGVVGNLKAIDLLLFSTSPTQNREGVQKTYQSILSKLNDLLKRMDEYERQSILLEDEKDAK
jgi:hypothetical protein